MPNQTTIGILIPAHNEEAGIRQAIESVFNQTAFAVPNVRLKVLVIADNCTDNTYLIVKSLQSWYQQLTVIKTQWNKDKKAGALNQGFAVLSAEEYDYIFSMDADSILEPTAIENALKEFSLRGNKLGGICCRIGLLPFVHQTVQLKPLPKRFLWSGFTWLAVALTEIVFCTVNNFWNWIWWAVQNLEYSIAQSDGVERLGRANCLAGPGTLFRTEVLRSIARTSHGKIWKADSNVEDYFLTKEINSLGYETRVGNQMFAYTDWPVGFIAHWKQRIRWYSGNLRTFYSWGVQLTFWECLDSSLQIIWFFCRIRLMIKLIRILQTGFIYIDPLSVWLLWGLPILTILMVLPKFRYVAYKSVPLFLLFCFFYDIYALWYGSILLSAVYLSNKKQNHW